MRVILRPVNLDSEREELLDILQRNLPGMPHARRFEWLYSGNPAGPAWSWFACEKETRQIVGVASVFPRAMWVGGKVRWCGQVGDFAIDPSHRSLGPALLLQRATFEPVDRGVLDFCYDCPPHEAGMSTFRRLGMQANCQVHRFARLLRVDRQVEKRLGKSFWSAPLVAIANFMLHLRILQKGPPGLEISVHAGRFGEEFSWLDEKATRKDVIRGRRRAADLNWRYREDPLHAYRVLTARLRGELVAFAVFFVSGQDASIVDLFGLGFPEAELALVEAVIQQCGMESVQTVDAFLSDENGLSSVLEEARFRFRSAVARVVAYAKPGGEVFALLNNRPSWSFCQAEILA